MSSIVPQFYDPNSPYLIDHLVQFSNPETAATTGSTASSFVLWGQDQFDPSVDNGAGNYQFVVSPDSNGETISSDWMHSLSEQSGNVSSELDVVAFSNCGAGLYDIAASHQSLGDDALQQDHHISQFGVDFKPAMAYPSPSTEENYNWEIQCNHEMTTMEESHIKVSKYSEEERKERIHRYLKKRSQRNFNKTIKYACRKTLANRRVRVRGRFAKNNASYDPAAELTMEYNDKTHENLSFDDQASKVDDEEDDWLRAAMANLVYLCQPSPHEESGVSEI